MLAILVSAVLAGHAAAHSCQNGQRVTCMKVQSTFGAPSTRGESYDAHGSPLCTPDGQKVFCLVDHDYHGCSAGEEPCCADGSNPHHRHDVGTGSGDGVTCTPEGAAKATVDSNVMESKEMKSNEMESNAMGAAPARPSPNSSAFQVILDDADAHEKTNAVPGSYQPCMKDAYKGNFHHDWAKNKGSAHFSYSFDPPKDGCYLLEEYHPGSDEMCARYLPSNAQLDLDYCRGGERSFKIDQGSKGAQWNPVGKAPFFKGSTGKITMKNAVGEQCREPPCFWVTDAFRLTWMEDRCSTDGNLMVQVRLSDASSQANVLDTMKENKDVLQDALGDYFGYQAVQLMTMVYDSRRLASGEQGVAKLVSRLVVFGTPKTTAAGDLAQALQKALSSAGAGVQIDSAAMDWTSQPLGSFPGDWGGRRKPTSSDTNNKAGPVVVIVGIVAVAAFFIAGALMLRFFQKKRAANKKAQKSTVAPEVVQDLEGAVVKDEKTKQEKDEQNQWEMESVSTATPTSEPTSDEICVAPQNSSDKLSTSESDVSKDIVI